MAQAERNELIIKYITNGTCTHDEYYSIVWNDADTGKHKVCGICNTEMPVAMKKPKEEVRQIFDSADLNILHQKIDTIQSELTAEFTYVNSGIANLTSMVYDLQKALNKKPKPSLYACDKCGSKTNGINEYQQCRTGFCDGTYRKISKDKKSETISCQCDNCGDESLSKNNNKLCFHCSKGIYKETKF